MFVISLGMDFQTGIDSLKIEQHESPFEVPGISWVALWRAEQ